MPAGWPAGYLLTVRDGGTKVVLRKFRERTPIREVAMGDAAATAEALRLIAWDEYDADLSLESLNDSTATSLAAEGAPLMMGTVSRDETGLVPASTLGTGTASSATYLRVDRTFATPTASVAATTVEVALGALAFRGKFTITDAAIGPTSKVLCWQAPGPYTGKGTRADEAEMQPVQVIAVEPATGSAVVRWQTPPAYTQPMLLPDGWRFATATALNEQMMFPTLIPRRIGKVGGNVKFSYTVMA